MILAERGGLEPPTAFRQRQISNLVAYQLAYLSILYLCFTLFMCEAKGGWGDSSVAALPQNDGLSRFTPSE